MKSFTEGSINQKKVYINVNSPRGQLFVSLLENVGQHICEDQTNHLISSIITLYRIS